MYEWPTATLGDVADLLTGFPFKSQDYTADDYEPKLLRGDNVAQGVLRWDGVKRWPSSAVDDLKPYWLVKDDVVLAMDRPWIEAGLKFAPVRANDLPCLLVQRVARLRGTTQVSSKFLRWVIGSAAFTAHVRSIETGTAVPHISSKQIKEFAFQLPPADQQDAIASILGALDDKIELNRRMNETLEAMARAIFKDWFVDFGPTRVKIASAKPYLAPDLWSLFPDRLGNNGLPEGWVERPLLDVARLISGGTPKTDKPEYWDGEIPWASAKDVSQCGALFLTKSERTITNAGLAGSSTKLVPSMSTVVVARGATTGRFCMFGIDMAMNQTCYALASNAATPVWLHLAFGTLVDRIVNAAHGSVFDTITTTTLQGVSVVEPGSKLVNACETITRPLYDQALANSQEAETLAALRDLLLPKLMSGELRVKDAEKMVGEAV